MLCFSSVTKREAYGLQDRRTLMICHKLKFATLGSQFTGLGELQVSFHAHKQDRASSPLRVSAIAAVSFPLQRCTVDRSTTATGGISSRIFSVATSCLDCHRTTRRSQGQACVGSGKKALALGLQFFNCFRFSSDFSVQGPATRDACRESMAIVLEKLFRHSVVALGHDFVNALFTIWMYFSDS